MLYPEDTRSTRESAKRRFCLSVCVTSCLQMLKDMTKAITAGDAKGFIGKSVLTVEPEKTFSAKA